MVIPLVCAFSYLSGLKLETLKRVLVVYKDRQSKLATAVFATIEIIQIKKIGFWEASELSVFSFILITTLNISSIQSVINFSK